MVVIAGFDVVDLVGGRAAQVAAVMVAFENATAPSCPITGESIVSVAVDPRSDGVEWAAAAAGHEGGASGFSAGGEMVASGHPWMWVTPSTFNRMNSRTTRTAITRARSTVMVTSVARPCGELCGRPSSAGLGGGMVRRDVQPWR